MRTTTRRLAGLTTATGAIGAALTLIAAGPAWAGTSQWPNCYHFQTGQTYWKAGPDFDGITPFHGIWENRNGDVVASETQYLKYHENMKLRVYGEGNGTWALRGIYIESDNLAPKGVKCTGPDDSLPNTVLAPLGDTVPLDTLGTLPPPPALGFLIEPLDVVD